MREIDDYTILPCPICGSVDLHISRLANECLSGARKSWSMCAIECAKCGLLLSKGNIGDVVCTWNTRSYNRDT